MNTVPDNVITVSGLGVSLGGRKILAGVSFEVVHGESLAIVGPNGAGKTTLLKCLAGILSSDDGQILVDGRVLTTYPRKELARRISYVPQADSRPVPFTVEQFILMGRYPYLSPFSPVSREDRQLVHHVMEQTDTAQFATRRLDTLSGGERQKVYIAAALVQGGGILMLDEPTTFLDYHHQQDITRLLRESAKHVGLTMISVTHDVNWAALESDRIVALREGRVVFQGTPKAIMQTEVLSDIYGCQFVLVDHPHRAMPMIVPKSTVEDPS